MRFIKIRKIAYLISSSLILVGLYSMIVKNGFNYGIDFTGGILVQVKFKEKIDASKLRNALSTVELGNMVIQNIGKVEDSSFIIKTKAHSVPAKTIKLIEDKIVSTFGKEKVNLPFERSETVGPAIGKDLRNLAYWLILVSLIGILIYVSIRFKFNFAVASIVALVHDVIITAGVLSILHKEINIPIIAAILTIIGYSLNDTIVVFDRIRENLKLLRDKSLETIIDSSITTTLSRTVITSGTTLLAVISLYMFGGTVIHDFSFTMLIGITVGTYSSIFVASPLYYEWEMSIAKKHGHKK